MISESQPNDVHGNLENPRAIRSAKAAAQTIARLRTGSRRSMWVRCRPAAFSIRSRACQETARAIEGPLEPRASLFSWTCLSSEPVRKHGVLSGSVRTLERCFTSRASIGFPKKSLPCFAPFLVDAPSRVSRGWAWMGADRRGVVTLRADATRLDSNGRVSGRLARRHRVRCVGVRRVGCMQLERWLRVERSNRGRGV